VIAHGCCTAVAVMGGRLLASKISVRHGSFHLTGFTDASYPWGCDIIPGIWGYLRLRSVRYRRIMCNGAYNTLLGSHKN